jgi:hypothetical protein
MPLGSLTRDPQRPRDREKEIALGGVFVTGISSTGDGVSGLFLSPASLPEQGWR